MDYSLSGIGRAAGGNEENAVPKPPDANEAVKAALANRDKSVN
jgi:hypothetical protein